MIGGVDTKVFVHRLLSGVFGVAIAVILVATGGSATKEAPIVKPLLVETLKPTAQDTPIPVQGTGVVTAAQQISLVPQVSGKIIQTDARLMPGGRFKRGEVIAQIDARDYVAMRDQAQSQAQRAELELALDRISHHNILNREQICP